MFFDFRMTPGRALTSFLSASVISILLSALVFTGCDLPGAESRDSLVHTQAEDNTRQGLAPSQPDPLVPGTKPEILIIGDSMMQFGIGPALKKGLENKGYQVTYFVKKSTGLTWTHFFDWQYKSQELLSSGDFNAIIVMLGSNDGRWLKHEGKRLHFGPDVALWWQQYSLRFDEFFGRLCNETGKVFWVGMPPMKPKAYHDKTRLFNRFYDQKIQNSGCGRYIHTDYLSTERPTRWKDGIHVSNSGGQMVAQRILKDTGL